MNTQSIVIAPLTLPVSEEDVSALSRLLVDAVQSGAAVSFLSPLTVECAAEWWRRTITGASDKAVFLIARDDAGICGTVQLHPSWAPNQTHRADIAKLIVHTRCRGAGLGKKLMLAIEDAALRAGFGLLTLDTKRGSAAEQLYRRLGWTCVGTIPGFALDPDGSALHDDVIFFKPLNRNV